MIPALAGLFALGIGISYVNFDNNSSIREGIVFEAKDNYFLFHSKGENLYVYQKEHNYEIGDYLKLEGKKTKLDFVVTESAFDFTDYLKKKGVKYEFSVTKVEVKFTNPIRINKYRKQFLSKFNDDQRSLIGAILFSIHDDSEDLTNISKLHISRLASASGIFIYAYLSVFGILLSRITNNSKVSILKIIPLFPYFIFTFPRFTVIRILFLEVLRYLNRAFLKDKYSSMTITGSAGILFLLLNPCLAYQMSFIMGFTLPIMISFIHQATFRYKGIKKRVSQLLLTYTGIIPFELKFYNGINPLSIFLVTILSPLFIVVGALSLLAFYGLPIHGFVGILVTFLSNLLDTLSKFAFQINAPPMFGILIFVFELLFFSLLYYQSIRFIPFIRLTNCFLLIFLAVYFLPITNTFTSEVCFINVGQGDACLIRKGNTAVFIDVGGNKYSDIATETLIPFLEKRRIYDIDLVIETHGDYDHVGSLDSLKENFYVKDVVDGTTKFPISIGGITFYNYNNHIEEMSEKNDQSLVVGFELNHTSYLVTGDAPIQVERNIMNEYEHIDCDILKVGHHGSNTSTCDEFVRYLSPKEAVISCGKNNRYGHPHQSVLQILQRYGIKIRRTDVEGTIIY